MRRTFILFCFMIFCCVSVSLAVEEVENYSLTLNYTPDEMIEFYRPEHGKPLALNMFYPEGYDPSNSYACIIFFFGGGWSGGSTAQFYAQAKYMASRGLVAISAQYRTSKSHNAIPRQCVEDGKTAIRYVRQHAEALGIDPNKIIVSGGSAGGHVAATTVMCPEIDADPDSPVSCVANAMILLNPVYDNGPGGYSYARVKNYWEEISPMHNIRAGLPPAVVFFGTKDRYVPVDTIRAFQEKMTEVGNRCETHIYEGAQHGFFNINGDHGGRKKFEDVLTKADAFLVQEGFLSGENHVSEWTEKSIQRLKEK